MDNIIPILDNKIGTELNSVNSRDIYKYLQVATKYADWIKRAIDKYEFVENEDFTILKNGNGSNAFLDYIVTLDMAKELCMVSNTPNGKETRKYFISIEKQAQKPLTVIEQIQIMATNHIEQEKKLTEHHIRLEKIELHARLTNQQEFQLKQVHNDFVYRYKESEKLDDKQVSKLHRLSWSAFKKKFMVTRYNAITTGQFDDAIEWHRNLSFIDLWN